MSVLLLAAETGDAPGAATGLLVIAALAAVAFLVGHATRRWVSEVIVFMIIGIVVGPEVLRIVEQRALDALEPVISLALGAIVFGIGERLEWHSLQRLRHTLTPIALLDNFATLGLTFGAALLFGADMPVAFLLGAIAMSTSPTTLVAVIGTRRAKGAFTDHLLAATALNNVGSALIYGIGLPIVLAASSSSGGTAGLAAFFQLVIASALIGGAGAFVLRRWMHTVYRSGDRLLFVLVVLVGIVAVSRAINAPVVISTLIAGALTANDRRDTRSLFEALRVLDAPIFLVFFLVAGAGVHFQELASVGFLGLAFVVGRTLGKVAGSWTGADLTRSGRRSGWAPWLGPGLSPFAGMAIGLAAFTLERANQAGLPELGSEVSAVVLGSVVVFELLGPLAVGRALDAAGESGRQPLEDSPGEDQAPHLIRHILVPLSSPEMARRKGGQIVDLAASTGAAVTALHVIPPGTRVDPNIGDPALSVLRQIAASRNVMFEPLVRESESVADAIVEEARRAAVDLVMLGESVPQGDEQGSGRQLVQEVASRVGPGVGVLVVPTSLGSAARGRTQAQARDGHGAQS